MPRTLNEESWRHSFIGILETRLMRLLPAFMCFSFNGGIRHGAAAPTATAHSDSTSRRVLGVLSISCVAILTSRILDLLIDQPRGYHHRDHGSQGAGRAAR